MVLLDHEGRNHSIFAFEFQSFLYCTYLSLRVYFTLVNVWNWSEMIVMKMFDKNNFLVFIMKYDKCFVITFFYIFFLFFWICICCYRLLLVSICADIFFGKINNLFCFTPWALPMGPMVGGKQNFKNSVPPWVGKIIL